MTDAQSLRCIANLVREARGVVQVAAQSVSKTNPSAYNALGGAETLLTMAEQIAIKR